MSEQAANKAGNEMGSITEGLPINDYRNVLRYPDPEAETHYVYFLYCAGFVKIGKARSFLRRARELQIGSPWTSGVVLLIPGGRRREEFLHFAFKESRAGGEWFRLDPPIRKAITDLAPPECLEWLSKEEEAYKRWLKAEAIHFGLLPEEQS